MIEHEQKEQFVTEMKADLAKAAGVVFLDYTGLTVAEVEQMRRKVRATTDVKYRVVKNTLMSRVLKDAGIDGASALLKGTPTGVMLGASDPVSTAKMAVEFTKDNKHIRIKGGILENKALNAQQTEALSKMASKREMLAGVVGMALGTGRRLAAQLKSPGGRIAGAIKKHAENLEKGSAQPA